MIPTLQGVFFFQRVGTYTGGNVYRLDHRKSSAPWCRATFMVVSRSLPLAKQKLCPHETLSPPSRSPSPRQPPFRFLPMNLTALGTSGK